MRHERLEDYIPCHNFTKTFICSQVETGPSNEACRLLHCHPVPHSKPSPPYGGPSPSTTTTSHILTTHRALVDTLTSFLTVCTHHILYLRRVYPPLSFLSTRAYNYPVRQNRHPSVCAWINDAIAAIRDQLTKNTIANISLCIYECDTNRVLERWTFDLHSFPAVAKRDRDVPLSSDTPGNNNRNNEDDDDDSLTSKINLVDLEATFRATLSRITTSSSRLKPLPEPPNGPECSFTLTIELSPSPTDRPVGRLEKEERKWIVAEPDSLPIPHDTSTNPSSPTPAAGKTHAIRRLSAGPLHLELYVAESAAKFTYNTPNERTPAVRAAEMSYGAGTEKFDPVHGYEDLEGTDVNRKPGGGLGVIISGVERWGRHDSWTEYRIGACLARVGAVARTGQVRDLTCSSLPELGRTIGQQTISTLDRLKRE